MDIYQHFRKEEQPFIDQAISWQESVLQSYQFKRTDFLDPREQYILTSIIGTHSDLHLKFFGGNQNTERKRAIIAPFYEDIQHEHFNITLLEGSFPNKFVNLTHRDVLGALMSLGIKRKKIGDIIVANGIVQIVVDEEIAPFIQLHLTGIKKASMKWSSKDLLELKEPDESWVEKEGTVSSLRLDVILKEIYRISRQLASDYVSKGFVKVNFRVVENPAFQVQQGDIISLRKKGRSKVVKIEGKTKKDKWRIISAMLK